MPKERWQTEIISESQGDHGGYKEVILRVAVAMCIHN